MKTSIPLKNRERVRGKRRQEANKNSQEQETVVRGQREKIQNGLMGDKRFEDEAGVGNAALAEGARLYSGSIHVREV